MKIEAGKYYRTNGGRKVGPMINFGDTGEPGSFIERDGDGQWWNKYGIGQHKAKGVDIIDEWTDAPDLTAITTPFGLLDHETQAALKEHGGPYERFTTMGNWVDWESPDWVPSTTYRVKPSPPKPREWWITGGACLWDTYTEAYNACERGEKPIHVREVLPE